MSTSLFSWEYLRPPKTFPALVAITLSFSFFLIPYSANAGIFQNDSTKTISELLKSELGIEAKPSDVGNLPPEKQSEIENTLLMLQEGRVIVGGKTDAEKALSVLTQLIQDETNKDILISTLETLLKMTNTPVSEAKDQVDTAQNMFYVWASLKAMGQIPRDGIMREYILARESGKTNNQAWNFLLEKYKGINKIMGCNFNIPISTGDDPETNCPRTVALLKANMETGDPRLHTYAKFAYDSYALTQQFNSKPELKQSLGQRILSEIAAAQKPQQPSLFSRITAAVTTAIANVAGAVQTFVTSGTQTITNSFKTIYPLVKKVKGVTLPNDAAVISTNDSSSGKQSQQNPNWQEQLRQIEDAKKKQAEAEKKRLEAERQKQEDQKKIDEQRRAQAAAEEALKKAKTEGEQRIAEEARKKAEEARIAAEQEAQKHQQEETVRKAQEERLLAEEQSKAQATAEEAKRKEQQPTTAPTPAPVPLVPVPSYTPPSARAPTCNLMTSQDHILPGQKTTILWKAWSAERGIFSSGTETTQSEGSFDVAPTQTTTYSATFTGPTGIGQCSMTITLQSVSPAGKLQLSIRPMSDTTIQSTLSPVIVDPFLFISPTPGLTSLVLEGPWFTRGGGITEIITQPDGTSYTLHHQASYDDRGEYSEYVDTATASLFGTYTISLTDDTTGKKSNTASFMIKNNTDTATIVYDYPAPLPNASFTLTVHQIRIKDGVDVPAIYSYPGGGYDLPTIEFLIAEAKHSGKYSRWTYEIVQR